MDARIVRINKQYIGPPTSANGGYAAGIIASGIEGVAAVMLKVPPPVDTDLTLASDGTAAQLLAGETVIGVGEKSSLDLAVPEVDLGGESWPVKALEDGGFKPFETCFVCGHARTLGDGLCIFCTTIQASPHIVIAEWTLTDNLADGSVNVAPEYIWSALDCPGYIACAPGEPALLGKLTAEIVAPLKCHGSVKVIGWDLSPEAADGKKSRKRRCGTAVFDHDGNLVAKAEGIWIVVSEEIIKAAAG